MKGMKKTISMTAITVLMASVSQATVLIDYIGNPDSVNHTTEFNDGDFSSAGTSTPWSDAQSDDPLSFKNNNGFDSNSADNIVIGFSTGSRMNAAIDTGHTLSLGDQFEAAYSWRNSASWDVTDGIVFSLYYTDTDAIDGVRTTIASFASGGQSAGENAWESETFGLTSALADAGAAGKTLYALMGTDLPDGTDSAFARVDNVYLEVVHSTTVLIDYVGNPDSVNHTTEFNDGDFSSAGTSTPWSDAQSESAVSFKDNNGFDAATDDNIVVGFTTGSRMNAAIDTGHTLSLGDQFEAAYSWRNSAGWEVDDEIVFSLYYTDTDAIDGVRTTIASFASGGQSAGENTWESETFGRTAALLDAGAAGKTLYALMDTSLPADGSSGFSRIDNVYLDVTSSVPNLVWEGGVNSDWDTSTLNWNSGATSYAEGGSVLFADNASAVGPVMVDLTAERSPLSVQFSNETKDYQLTGSSIAGGSSMVKDGAAKLTLVNSNTYAGNTSINAGVLAVGQVGAIPSGAGKGDVVLGGTLDLNGFAETINGLTGAGVVDNSAAGVAALTVGSDDDTSTFSGTVQDSGGALSLVKAGSGTLTLSGSSSHSGTTTVQAGELHLSAPESFTTASSIVVESGATLSMNSTGTAMDVPSLTLNGGTLRVDYGALDFIAPTGVLIQAGVLELNGDSTLDLSGTDFGLGNYILFDATTQTGSGTLTVLLPYGVTGQVVTDGSQMIIEVTDVPGPPLGYRPNFVIILADDMNWRDCGPYVGMTGGITSTTMPDVTPNIDTLATQGMTFNYTFTPASMCSPCRGNLYSGIYPVRSGAQGNHTVFKDGTKSIAHHLQQVGYKVKLTGKLHIGPSSSYPWDGSVDFNAVDPFCYIYASNYPHGGWSDGTKPYNTAEQAAITFPPDYVNTPQTRLSYNKYLAEIGKFDDEVGALMAQIEAAGKTDSTVFIILTEQGSSFPGAKWTCYDLGIRAGCVIRWPDGVPANVRTNAMIEYTDIVPTLIQAAGGTLPVGPNRLDGRSFLEVLLNDKPEHRNYVYSQHTAVHHNEPAGGYAIRAIRSKQYKLIWNLQHTTDFSNIVTDLTFTSDETLMFAEWIDAATTDPAAAFLVNRYLTRPEYEFYDIEADPYELNNVYSAPAHAAQIAEMKVLLEQWMGYQAEQFVDDASHPRYAAGPLVKNQGIWTEQNVSANRQITEVEPIEVWANFYGLTGADRDPTADSDGDGLTQLNEWATGRDPNVADGFDMGIASPDFGNDHVDLDFDRLLMHENYAINYVVETSEDLAADSWIEVNGTVQEWPVPQAGELVENTTVRVPITSDTKQFFRVKVEAQ
jgi:uncharacterized sulfatase